MIKIPVLIIGTNKLETIKLRTLFFFFNKLKIIPETNPASVHFNRHAKTVPTGLTGINTAIVDGESKAITPLKKPTIAPDNGPPSTAAKTIATSEMLMLTGPNCK